MTGIRKIRITGGPKPHDIRVTDADTGQELYVRSIEFNWSASDGICYAKVELVAEVNVMAFVASASAGLLEAQHEEFAARVKASREEGA